MTQLRSIKLNQVRNHKGEIFNNFELTYSIFGNPDNGNPWILIFHALTGNSEVGGENGWWKDVVGAGRGVDTNRFNVICFDIPGNGFGGERFTFSDYDRFQTADIAVIIKEALDQLRITYIEAAIGASVGGMIGYQLIYHYPTLVKKFIPLGSHYKTSDFVFGHCLIQDKILESGSRSIGECRGLAMLFYRGHQSLEEKFESRSQSGVREIESYLDYQGEKLERRFSYNSYRVVNYLLKTHNCIKDDQTIVNFIDRLESSIHHIAIDTDILFPSDESYRFYRFLLSRGKDTKFYNLRSSHGHDGFFVETEQLNRIFCEILIGKKVKKNKAILV